MWLLGAILSIIMFIVGLSASIEDSNNWSVTIVLLFLSIFCIKKYFNSKKPNFISKKEKKKNEKYEKEKLVPGTEARSKELGADLCIKAIHMTGLPIAEGADVILYRAKDKVIFERNQDTFELDIKKIKDILIKTDEEIQKSYVSSIGGAEGWSLLFGSFGTMYGGRAIEKTSKVVEKYLIFSYDKDGETKFMSFDVTNDTRAHWFTVYYDLTYGERKVQHL